MATVLQLSPGTARSVPVTLPPPQVRGLPILGNSLDMVRDPFGLLPRLYKQYGPLFRFKALKNYLVLAGPEANKFLATTDDDILSSQEVFTGILKDLGTANFLPALNGSAHRHRRKILHQQLGRHEATASAMPGMVRVLHEEVCKLQLGTSYRVKPLMQRFVAEQMGRIFLHAHLGTRLAQDAVIVAETLFGAGAAGSLPGLMLHVPPYRGAKSRLVRFLMRLIDLRREDADLPTTPDHPDYLDAVLAARDEAGHPFSDAELLSTALLPFIAGMGQTGPMISFLLYELLKRPELLRRVQAEIDEAFQDGPPTTFLALQKMVTLHGAAMETLRLYPVAMAAPRYVLQPVEFLGYVIEPHQMIFVGTSVTHFMEEFFPDPKTFDVTRYQSPRNEHRQPGAFAPFALGPHTCVAADLAKVMVVLTIATLLYFTELELDPGYTLKTVINPTPGPEKKYRVHLVGWRHQP